MKYNIEYDSEKKYVLASIENDIELEPLKRYISDIANVLKKHNCHKILADLRAASVNMNIIEIDDIPRLSLQFGIDAYIKRALVVSDDFKKYDFFESTSRSHNQNVKIFSNYSEAEKWLLDNEKFSTQPIPISKINESE